MDERFSREIPLIGEEGIKTLRSSHVAVVGLGGVGGFAVEALARAGVGELTLVDADTVSRSNLNRQIIATDASVGMKKTDAMAARVSAIDPDIKLHLFPVFVEGESELPFSLDGVDYVVDAIDYVPGKIEIALRCAEANVPSVAAMGAGNKLDPTRFEVADLSKTEVDPLARALRTKLSKRGIKHLKVVYSKERPVKPPVDGKPVPSSISFVPGVMGMILAGEVIKDLVNTSKDVKG